MVSDHASEFVFENFYWRGHAFEVSDNITLTELWGGYGNTPSPCAASSFYGAIFEADYTELTLLHSSGGEAPQVKLTDLLGSVEFTAGAQTDGEEVQRVALESAIELHPGQLYVIAQGSLDSGSNCHRAANELDVENLLAGNGIIQDWFPSVSLSYRFGGTGTPDSRMNSSADRLDAHVPLVGFRYSSDFSLATCPPDITDICIDDDAFLLVGGEPESGTYSGPGVTGGEFDPLAAGVGEHTITYSRTDPDDGITSTCTFAVTVNDLPTVTATSNSPVSLGQPITLTGEPDGMESYSWTGPDGFSSAEQNPTIDNATLNMEGTYTLVVQDGNQCNNTTSVELEVIAEGVSYDADDLINIFIAGTGEGEYDRLHLSTGTLTPGGATLNLFPCYTPEAGDRFVIFKAPTVDGEFSSPPLIDAGGNFFVLSYEEENGFDIVVLTLVSRLFELTIGTDGAETVDPDYTYTLNVVAEPPAGGNVGPGQTTFTVCDEIDIEANANEGYVFTHWTQEGGALIANTASSNTTVTMPAGNITLTAVFQQEDDSDIIYGDGVTDIDGNEYVTVVIGEQEWMAENLRVTRDADENEITRYCYDDEETNCDLYGGLYNWFTVMNGENSSIENPSGVQGICPTGWHVPSDAEWTELLNYLDSQGFPNSNVTVGAGNALKSCRQVDHPDGAHCETSEHPRWDSDDTHHGFDEIGFSALPAGNRDFNGLYGGIGSTGYWWSSAGHHALQAFHWSMGHSSGNVGSGASDKGHSFSLRCVRDID